MKVGRNDPCPCGSGKKYKRCCMDAVSKQHSEIADDISQTIAMNPTLTEDELNRLAQQKMVERNNRPIDDFCGLSPTQMSNWLYAPFNELTDVKISVPSDLSASPVMRYLSVMLDAMVEQGGSIKATAKGNLPAKLVQQASALLPEFAVAEFETMPSISDYTGSNEDKFNALHYTRVLAELAGIINFERGRFHLSDGILKQYQQQGIAGFFLPLLETVVEQYNWGYLDGWSDDVSLKSFWLFMLWRLQSHGSLERLIKDVETAFPDLVKQVPKSKYRSQQDLLGVLIEVRFIENFLQFWGFVTMDPKRVLNGEPVSPKIAILPLLTQSFKFLV
ncbi:YecA family protein [Zooshikella ganghwensis]|uniref:YecA family protein n=1 Tax=Zooshikella ganghwensis TaxID=202772 RepID=UPI00040C9D99|nr:SEC-C metal-binding domain-containing protein [Zooshikella ganghwensis]